MDDEMREKFCDGLKAAFVIGGQKSFCCVQVFLFVMILIMKKIKLG